MKKLSLFLVALTMILFSCKTEVEKPTVVTKSVGEVTETTAKVVGQVTADGGAEVTERGVCWNTEGAPEVIDYRTVDGTGVGTFNSNISDLVPNTQYYVRAYATNEKGVSYGEELTFTTKKEIELPEVKTAEVEDITESEAVSGGEVISDGGAEVTARGICWSTKQTPTIEDDKTADGTGVGNFTSNLSNLEPQTTYYVRAYATNEVGTAYGEEVSFTTLTAYSPSPATGTSNGYGYVDLGLSVKWATCNVGANAPEEYGDYYAWGETTTKSDYFSLNCPTFGLSYSSLQSQGYIDSEGNLTAQYDAATANWGGNWRMPTKAEQEELLNNCTWTWTTYNGVKGYNVEGPNGNSIFLPAADDRYGSSIDRAGSYGYYWSSTPGEFSDLAYGLFFSSGGHYMYDNNRGYGLSVRSVLE